MEYQAGNYLFLSTWLFFIICHNLLFLLQNCKTSWGERFSLIVFTAAAAAAKSLQSCPTLCDPRDGSLPGSSVPGIFQARTLEWVAISFSDAWEWKVKVKSLSRVRLFAIPDPMDCSPPGSSIHGIFQARVLEWGAIAFSVQVANKHIKTCPTSLFIRKIKF